jgi:flagellar biosynthetic protein FliR
MPRVDPASAPGLFIAIQQLVIGLAMGFVIRIALTAAEMAGQLAGLQMGLGFAVFFDPQSSAQTAVVGQFMGLFALLLFLSINGHALVITALAESFQALPVSAEPLAPLGFRLLAGFGGVIFGTGLLISLPVIAALLIANVAVGIMTRAAPQLNLFAVGFPITLVTGFVALYLSIPFIGPGLVRMFEQAVMFLLSMVQALR